MADQHQNADTATPGVDTATSESATPAFRYDATLANTIETQWQDFWEQEKTFETPNPAGPLADTAALAGRGEKLFVLDMFPYPSGSGLHVGHPLGYISTDIYSRYMRMLGRNVLYSMGYDAFGLPAEQYAVQTGQHPAITTEENVNNYRRQLRRLGLSHDNRRSVSTTDADYYRWTQWIFRTIFNAWFDEKQNKARPIDELIAEFENGERQLECGSTWAELDEVKRAEIINSYRLAYVSDAPVNWCPGLGTVVANEEVTADGRSDRGNFPVFKRNMRQWMMRITSYADRLLDDLDLLDWSEAVKTMQRNWIGRSTGANVDFNSEAGTITVFTTRPDTLFGASFMVLAPEHPLVDALTTEDRAEEVAAYRAEAAAKNDIDRTDDTKEKTGVALGGTATNPLTGQEIPVWIADYVMMGYGTGAIMAVPCGDTRDFEFARKFGLDIPAIQRPPADWFEEHDVEISVEDQLDTSKWPTAFVGDAPYVNSANESLDLNSMTDIASAVETTTRWLQSQSLGHEAVTYKLRDWLFSRQRYWGEPFPIVYDEHDQPHVLPDSALPVLLPETDSFSPRTFDAEDAESNPESPLDRLDDWVNIELDLGDGLKTYRRDTNVMPQWAGSCWYELRYLDPTNSEVFVDPEVEKYWMGPRPEIRPDHPGGVDLYVGGVEHAVLHLLYARFWHKVLFDLGYVSSKEPYYRLFNQGYILANAFKDDRGIYVEAKDVAERDGKWFLGDVEVEREWGKMGKSLKNAVSPDEMCAQYGADTLRLYEMAMGPLDQSRPWETRDVVGMYRFLARVWRNIIDENTGETKVSDEPASDELNRVVARTIDVCTTEMSHLRFNTTIAQLIQLNNELTKLDVTARSTAEALVLMLAPLAPHISEELWKRLGHESSLAYEPYPVVADKSLLVDDMVELPVQVNGKVRGRVTVSADASADEVETLALADENVARTVGDNTVKKVIVIPGRMVNIVI